MACHAKDKKLVGSGAFGPIPMPPNTVEKINDADLKAAIDYILKV